MSFQSEKVSTQKSFQNITDHFFVSFNFKKVIVMNKILLTISLSLIMLSSWAGEINSKLIGESTDGKTVKMMWFIKKWDKNLTGFNIKRKTLKGEWVTINSETIIPNISVDNNIQNVENNTKELMRLRLKLNNLINSGKLNTITNSELVQTLTNNNESLKALTQSFGIDYDMALLTGFGLVDRNVPSDIVQYGLFYVRNNNEEDIVPSAVMNWKSGEVTNANPVIHINSNTKGCNVQLYWNVTFQVMDQLHTQGFNIYRKDKDGWIKINNSPISEFDNQKNAYTFTDVNNKEANTEYAVATATMFNNEGFRNEFAIKVKPAITETVATTGRDSKLYNANVVKLN